jgi:hypothetical protein
VGPANGRRQGVPKLPISTITPPANIPTPEALELAGAPARAASSGVAGAIASARRRCYDPASIREHLIAQDQVPER